MALFDLQTGNPGGGGVPPPLGGVRGVPGAGEGGCWPKGKLWTGWLDNIGSQSSDTAPDRKDFFASLSYVLLCTQMSSPHLRLAQQGVPDVVLPGPPYKVDHEMPLVAPTRGLACVPDLFRSRSR